MTASSARARRPSLVFAMTTIAVALAAYPSPDPVRAQDFPNRPIKLIVGPSPDVFSRIIAEHLQQAWGQPVVVEPRPGGGGKLAAAAVAGAEPDGHTLLFATPTYTLNAAMKLASYDLVKEFEPVSIIGVISYALVVHPSVPARSVAELVALAKARPGALNCASAGIGTVPHLACETLNKSAGVNVVHVPYRERARRTCALQNGVDRNGGTVKEQTRTGELRAGLRHPILHAGDEPRRGCERLSEAELPGRLVEGGDIGEGPAHVGRQPNST